MAVKNPKPSPEPLAVPPWADDELSNEPRRVYHWRREVLIQAGYPPRDASMLAHKLDVDLHEAVGLLMEGCAEPLAVRILL